MGDNYGQARAYWDGAIESHDNEALSNLTKAYFNLHSAKFEGDCLLGDLDWWKSQQSGDNPPTDPKKLEKWAAEERRRKARLAACLVAIGKFGDSIYNAISPLLAAIDAAMPLIEKREERIKANSSEFRTWLRNSQGIHSVHDGSRWWGDKDEFIHEFPNWHAAEVTKLNIRAARKLIVEALETQQKLVTKRKEKWFTEYDSELLTDECRAAASWSRRFPRELPKEYNKYAVAVTTIIAMVETAVEPVPVCVLDLFNTRDCYTPSDIHKDAAAIIALLGSAWDCSYDPETFILTAWPVTYTPGGRVVEAAPGSADAPGSKCCGKGDGQKRNARSKKGCADGGKRSCAAKKA